MDCAEKIITTGLTSTDAFKIPPNFSYRGEGNSSVVLSLGDTHEILRLYKRSKPKSILGWFVDWLKKIFNWDHKNEMDRETKNLKFYSVVMRSLMGHQFVCGARQVYLSGWQVKELDECLFNLRPGEFFVWFGKTFSS